MARRPGLGVDALNSLADQPGAAAGYYGWSKNANDSSYIFGDRALGAMQAGIAEGNWSGGNRQIHKILTGLGTSSTGANQAFVKAQPNVGALFAEYFKTGKVPKGLSPARAIQAYDYALRATGVDAVKDRNPGLLGGLVKGNIGALIGTVGGFALGGPLGAKIGGSLGGFAQGVHSDGLLGGLKGGLTGYGIGSGGAWLGGKVTPGFTGALSSGAQAAAPIVNGAGNFIPGPAYGGSGAAKSFALGAKAGIPFAGTSGASTIGSGLAGTTGSTGGVLGSFLGGGKVSGALGSLISGTGKFLTNGGSDLLGLGLNYWGSQKALDYQKDAARGAFEAAEFRPYSIDGPGGSVYYDGNTIHGALSPENLGIVGQQLGSANEYYDRWRNFDRPAFSADAYDRLYQTQLPEETAYFTNELEKIYNTGNWGSTTGDRSAYGMYQALNNADIARRESAFNQGVAEEGRLFDAYMNSVQGYQNTAEIPIRYIDASLSGGNYRSANNANAYNPTLDYAQQRSDSTAAFWNGLGELGGKVGSKLMERSRSAQEAYKNRYYPGGFSEWAGLS